MSLPFFPITSIFSKVVTFSAEVIGHDVDRQAAASGLLLKRVQGPEPIRSCRLTSTLDLTSRRTVEHRPSTLPSAPMQTTSFPIHLPSLGT